MNMVEGLCNNKRNQNIITRKENRKRNNKRLISQKEKEKESNKLINKMNKERIIDKQQKLT